VARLLFDQLEQNEPKLAPVEHPPPSAAAAIPTSVMLGHMLEKAAAPAAAPARRAIHAARAISSTASVMKSKTHSKILC
jgi:hypothetical protein